MTPSFPAGCLTGLEDAALHDAWSVLQENRCGTLNAYVGSSGLLGLLCLFAEARCGVNRRRGVRSIDQRPDAAVERFEKALQLQPGATQVHYALALMSELSNLTVGAPGHAHRADQAVLEGRFRDAVQEYRQATILSPENYDYRKSLALTEYKLGRTEAAIQSMREALELLVPGRDAGKAVASSRTEPSRAKELSLARYTLGGMLANQGASEMALAEFRQALELDPDNLDVRLQMGRLLGKIGQLQKALHHSQEVVRKDPDQAEANRLAATTLMDLGRFAEALPYLHRLVKLEPGNEHDSWLLRVATEQAEEK